MNVRRLLVTAAGAVLVLFGTLLVAVPSASAASTTIKLVTPASPVLLGDPITLGGYASGAAGRYLYLEVSPVTSTSWSRLPGSTRKLTSTGTWRHTVTPSASRRFRAVLPATSTKPRRVSTALTVKVVTGWRQLATGRFATCGIRHDRTLWCWGMNFYGQLATADGVGEQTPMPTPRNIPSPVPGATWTSVSVGAAHTCGRLSDATAWCWGRNAEGQLSGGDAFGSQDPSVVPRQVGNIVGTSWRSVVAGAAHTCGIDTAGTLWCWGRNTWGEAGGAADQPEPTTIPTPVNGVGWRQVSAQEAAAHTCATLQDATLWCFGYNVSGQLGPGPAEDGLPHIEPNQVAGSWLSVSVGRHHTCGRRTDGTARCWGSNIEGQLGISAGHPSGPSQPPTTPGSPFNGSVATIAAGSLHTCGRLAGNTLWCWGSNEDSQLGAVPEAVLVSTSPVQVPGAWRTVSAAATHTCAIRTDHSGWCWGTNLHGQLGFATNAGTGAATPPTKVGFPSG